MKNRILKTVIGVSFMLLVTVNLTQAQAQDGRMQALQNEIIDVGGEERVVCNCNFWGNCRASGSRALCAQSEEGGNIKCSSYNSNC